MRSLRVFAGSIPVLTIALLFAATPAFAQEDIAAAKKKVEDELKAAAADVEALAPALAGEIARTILGPTAPSGEGTRR